MEGASGHGRDADSHVRETRSVEEIGDSLHRQEQAIARRRKRDEPEPLVEPFSGRVDGVHNHGGGRDGLWSAATQSPLWTKGPGLHAEGSLLGKPGQPRTKLRPAGVLPNARGPLGRTLTWWKVSGASRRAWRGVGGA